MNVYRKNHTDRNSMTGRRQRALLPLDPVADCSLTLFALKLCQRRVPEWKELEELHFQGNSKKFQVVPIMFRMADSYLLLHE